MNMYDIAKETGFSIATISRAINNSGYVSEKTREKIMKVIDEKGYSVNPFAKGMATSTMSLAGVLSTDSRDLYQAECIYYLQNALRKQGYTTLLACTGSELKNKQEAMRLLLSRNVDVIFLIGSGFVEKSGRDNMYIKEAASKIPVILMNGLLENSKVHSIRCDDVKGMKELATVVLNGGSKKPILLTRKLTFSAREKVKGFEEACQKARITTEGRILQLDPSRKLSEHVGEVLDGQDFDAILCVDDEIAVFAMKYCLNHGFSIPDQVQITGYNNSLLSDMPPCEITSYDNLLNYLCDTSVSCMVQVLDGKDYPRDSVFSGTLVTKMSTNQTEE